MIINTQSTDKELEQMVLSVNSCLAAHFIDANVTTYSSGPVFTLFSLMLAPGTRISKITSIIPELTRTLAVRGVQVLDYIPNTSLPGLLVTNHSRKIVTLNEIITTSDYAEFLAPLPLIIGIGISGKPVVIDLCCQPHLLVAGTAMSGKSILIHAMIINLLYKSSPEELRLILIDTGQLELLAYNDIPHLLAPVITVPDEAVKALCWITKEIKRRYKLFQALGSRNLEDYNQKISNAQAVGRAIPDPYWKPVQGEEPPILSPLPRIVFVSDDYADMLANNESSEEMFITICRQGHPAGIHLILITRTPLSNVITRRIKSNIPARIALTVTTKSDSRLILDHEGAESLLGAGDLLYLSPNSLAPERIQSVLVNDQDIHNAINTCNVQTISRYSDVVASNASYDTSEPEVELDPLFDEAVGFVTVTRKASISGIQRQFRIGYNRAARLIEEMEVQGIVSSQGYNGNREVLVP